MRIWLLVINIYDKEKCLMIPFLMLRVTFHFRPLLSRPAVLFLKQRYWLTFLHVKKGRKTNFILMEMWFDFPRWQFPYFPCVSPSTTNMCHILMCLNHFDEYVVSEKLTQKIRKRRKSRFSYELLNEYFEHFPLLVFFWMCVHVTNEIIITYLRDLGKENVKSCIHTESRQGT